MSPDLHLTTEWTRIVAKRLIKAGLTNSCSVNGYKLKLRYKNGYTCSYRYSGMAQGKKTKYLTPVAIHIPTDIRFNHVNFNCDLLGENYVPHVWISHDDAHNYGDLGFDVAMCRLAQHVHQHRDRLYDFDEIALSKSFARIQGLRKYPLDRAHTHSFRLGSSKSWMPLWIYLFAPKEGLTELQMFRACTKMRGQTARYGVYEMFYQHFRNSGFYKPNAMAAFLRGSRIKHVLDVCPETGMLPIACSLAGIKYSAVPSPQFDYSLDRGLVDRLRIDYIPYDQDGRYDAIVAIPRLGKFCGDMIEPFRHQAKLALSTYSVHTNPSQLPPTRRTVSTRSFTDTRLITWL